ncbi:MAG: hypothetical protein M3417_09195 [Actinomycetota bacterium]|nr:hypothetical protein [Actinomycetota bacterium]
MSFKAVWGKGTLGLSLAVVGASAGGAAPAHAQQPGLPRTYDAQRIDTPNPISGASFGWGISSADLTADGKLDLLVAQSQTGPGQVFVYDGATGRNIDTINPPERNPANANGSVTAEQLSFVYVETMPDIGSCPGGDGPDADKICDLPAIGPGDGIPEILAGSRSLRVDATDASAPAVGAGLPGADQPIGRGYVLDGRTRAVLKRIDMPQADRMAQQARNASPQFARVMISPQALPPCAGSAAENNNAGVGPCPVTPTPVRIGDLNGGGQPDIVITARSYLEASGPAGSAAPGSECRVLAQDGGTCSAGKAWAYAGEEIAGSNPRAILETAMFDVQNPDAQGGRGRGDNTMSTEFGGNLFRLGDVTGDNRPEFVIPARNTDYPLKDPDPGFRDVGTAYLFNGATFTSGDPARTTDAGAPLATYLHPEIQARSTFGVSFNGGRATGDLGADTLPDLLLPSPLQNDVKTDDGEVYVFNGAPTGSGGGAQGSFHFATLRDPEPKIGGNFGGAHSGAGDLVGGLENPANEVIVGGFRFENFTEASQSTVTSLHIINAQTERTLQSIPDPDRSPGSGFGIGITPMGDLNGDGFLDVAASSYLYNGTVAGQGRAYILKSNDTPLPAAPAPGPQTPVPPQAPAPLQAVVAGPPAPPSLLPGKCKNEITGTPRADRLRGTLAGDGIFGLGGADVIDGFQGADCIDAGSGNDRMVSGPGDDRLIGGTGDDRLQGEADDDRLFGGAGKDTLVGGAGRDMLAGGTGNDVLSGGSDRDQLFGEAGNDTLRAGDGRNRLDGGAGNDRLESRNGEVDDVRCGSGRRDRAIVDRADRVSGCESISRPRARSARSR